MVALSLKTPRKNILLFTISSRTAQPSVFRLVEKAFQLRILPSYNGTLMVMVQRLRLNIPLMMARVGRPSITLSPVTFARRNGRCQTHLLLKEGSGLLTIQQAL